MDPVVKDKSGKPFSSLDQAPGVYYPSQPGVDAPPTYMQQQQQYGQIQQGPSQQQQQYNPYGQPQYEQQLPEQQGLMQPEQGAFAIPINPPAGAPPAHMTMPMPTVPPPKYNFAEMGDTWKTDKHAQKSRMGFIRKTYMILFVQLAVTFGVVFAFTTVDAIKEYVQQNMWMYYLALFGSLGCILGIACVPGANVFPRNLLLLSLFTVFESYLLGVFASYYNTESVAIAVCATLFISLGLSLFACQTKFDFTGMGPYLFVVLLCFILFGFMSMFFCWFAPGGCRYLSTLYAIIGVLIFSMYLVYDTQLIIGGKHKKFQFSTDDYVFAALSLYLDIANIFIYILALFGGRD